MSYSALIGMHQYDSSFFDKNPYYALNPIDKQFYGGVGQSGRTSLTNGFQSMEGGGDDWFPAYGWFVYSDKQITDIPLGPAGNIPTLDQFGNLEIFYSLYKGWNTIGIAPVMDGYSIDELKGTCNILSAYVYEGDSGWYKLPEQELTKKLDYRTFGRGMLIKVADNCHFDFSRNSGKPQAPPSLPTSPSSQTFKIQGYSFPMKIGEYVINDRATSLDDLEYVSNNNQVQQTLHFDYESGDYAQIKKFIDVSSSSFQNKGNYVKYDRGLLFFFTEGSKYSYLFMDKKMTERNGAGEWKESEYVQPNDYEDKELAQEISSVLNAKPYTELFS